MSAWTNDPILQVTGLISNELFWKYVHTKRLYETTFHSLTEKIFFNIREKTSAGAH